MLPMGNRLWGDDIVVNLRFVTVSKNSRRYFAAEAKHIDALPPFTAIGTQASGSHAYG